METISFDRERIGLMAVAAAGGFMTGCFLTRYLSSSSSGPPTDRGAIDERDADTETMSCVDTPRSMDSTMSFAFQPATSRLAHSDRSAAGNGMLNSDSQAPDIKMALLIRVDLALVCLLLCLLG